MSSTEGRFQKFDIFRRHPPHTVDIVDSKRRFSATVEMYDRYRPSYPAELVDWVLKTAGIRAPAAAADIGCGTGISTRLFAERGIAMTGVDANQDMLARAKAHGGAEYLKGESQATGLSDASFDLVIAAQAFHWFDVEPTLREFKRILKEGGACAAFWNDRANDTPFMEDYEELLLRSSTEYKKLRGKAGAIADIIGSPSVTGLAEGEFRNVQRMDRGMFLGRVYSSSYVVHGVGRPREFATELDELFERHEEDGLVEFVYRAAALSWRLR